jgi:hypothetical protein
MSIEDRLARLKTMHQKPKRPASGMGKKQIQRLASGMGMAGGQ